MQEEPKNDFATNAGTIAGIVVTIGCYAVTFWPLIKDFIVRY